MIDKNIMLSICLPVYNFSIVPLLTALLSEIRQKNLDVELICIDDASQSKIKVENVCFCREKSLEYIALKENIGRAAIRNLFLKYAKGDYLLFLDCDGMPVSDDFIEMYLKYILSNKPLIVYGGRIYPAEKPERKYLLRWKYGRKYESMPLESRLQNPNKSFQTNNFVIKHELFEVHRFNEKIKNYGHEDTLFGLDLAQNEIIIEHIDNPVLNMDIEEAQIFLQKTEKAVRNLIYLTDNHLIGSDSIQLLAFRKKIPAFFLSVVSVLATPISGFLKFLMENYLTSSPKIFNLYKFLIFERICS